MKKLYLNQKTYLNKNSLYEFILNMRYSSNTINVLFKYIFKRKYYFGITKYS